MYQKTDLQSEEDSWSSHANEVQTFQSESVSKDHSALILLGSWVSLKTKTNLPKTQKSEDEFKQDG